MSIPASYLVAITPRTIRGGSADLATNGMLLTKSAFLPSYMLSMPFGSASAVAAVFGDESVEAKFALQYFTGLTNQQKAPESLVIGRRVDEDAPAFLRSAKIEATLAEVKAITEGDLTIVVGGNKISATQIDLSSATSLSQAAELIAEKVEGVTGAYSSVTGMITLTTEAVGAEADISFAEGSVAELLNLTSASGAVCSHGIAALSEASNLDAIAASNSNWTQFTTAWEVTDEEEAKAYSAWADLEDAFCYIFWSSDTKMGDVLTQDATIASKLRDSYNCTCMVFGDILTAAFVCAYPATIKWDAVQGMKVLFGKSTSNISPMVTGKAQAEALDALKVSYFGQFATRNAEFQFANRGELTGSMYGFIDVLIAMIWFNAKLQRSIMDGFASVNRVPYNARGYTMIDSWCSDPIRAAKTVGVIDEGLALSNSQKAQIMQEFGKDITKDLVSNGYVLEITDPEANVRAKRGSPVMNLVYCYAGSVQKVELPVTCVL